MTLKTVFRTVFACLFFCLLSSPSSAQTAVTPPDQKIEVVFVNGRRPPTVAQTLAKAKVKKRPVPSKPKAVVVAPVRERAAQPIEAPKTQARPAPPVAPPAPPPQPKLQPPPIPTESPPPPTWLQRARGWPPEVLLVIPVVLLLYTSRRARRRKRFSSLLNDMHVYADICYCQFLRQLTYEKEQQRLILKDVKAKPHLGKVYLWLKRSRFPSDEDQKDSVKQVLAKVEKEYPEQDFRYTELIYRTKWYHWYRKGWLVIEFQHCPRLEEATHVHE